MNAIAKVSYTHEAMADLIVAEPMISQEQLAKHFGYSAAWVCQIISSDAFQEILAVRRKDIINPTLVSTAEERFRAVADRGLQVLQEKLSGPAFTIPDSLALKAAELGAKGLGIGGFGTPQPVPPPALDTNRLNQLAERLLGLSKGATIEGEIIQVQ